MEDRNHMKEPWAKVERSDMNGQWTEEEQFIKNIWFRELGLQRRGVIGKVNGLKMREVV